MSREDLDKIQTQLKIAIQNHQKFVFMMKQDPQNAAMQNQLRQFQTEITSLSEKQRMIVQHLRKNLVPSQSDSETRAISVVKNEVDIHKEIHQKEMLILASPAQQCNKVLKHTASKTGTVKEKPAVLIRVPQYTLSKTLKSANQHVFVSEPSLLNSVTRSPSGLLSPISHYLAQSESHLHDIRKSAEKKQLSQEEKHKIEFMAAIDLVTPSTVKDLQNRRSERKRRSTANPQFSYFEPEKKRTLPYLTTMMTPGVKRPRGRPPKHSPNTSRPSTPESLDGHEAASRNQSQVSDIHEDFCAVCCRSGELLMCDTCSLVYHLQCLSPPLAQVPPGNWSCPKCQLLNEDKDHWHSGLDVVHSYITQKTGKEEEKQKLHKKNIDLLSAHSQLELQAKHLSDTLSQQIQQKTELLTAAQGTQQSVEKLKSFVHIFQKT